MLAAAIAIASSLSWGLADFLGGVKSRTLAVLTILALAQPFGFAVAAALALAHAEPPPGREVLWAIPAALLATVGIAAFYRGMAVGAISVVAPIVAVGAVIPVAVGVMLGDPVGAVLALGFALTIGGVVLTSREPGAARGARLAAGVPWGVLAAIGFGGYFVPMHAAGEADFVWAVLVFRSTVLVVIAAAVLALRPSLRVGRRDLVAVAAIGLFDAGGSLLFAVSAGFGNVSVTSVLASLYPVVTVLLAWAYLREGITAWQRVGVAVTLAGVGLVTAA